MLWMLSQAAADPLVALVVIDPEAREEGFALEIEDLVFDDALPLDVAEGERVRIVAPDGRRHELDVAPGEAWEIQGADGEAWMARLGEEVRTDVLLVRGDPSVVEALARALDAVVREHEEQDAFLLSREGLLFDAPWVASDATAAIESVSFVPTDTPPDRAPPRSHVWTPPAPVQGPAPTPRAPAPAPVAVAVPVPLAAILPSPAAAGPSVAPPEPVAPTPEAAPLGVPKRALDPEPYIGQYLCLDRQPLYLGGGGGFASAEGTGTWVVSAPGVVRLFLDDGRVMRASIETWRSTCRAVW